MMNPGRALAALLALAAIASLSSSCSREPRPEPSGHARNLPSRIISLSPGATEILFALGLDSEVAGVTNYCNYPPEAAAKPRVGGLYDLNFEALISLDPDLVILTPATADVAKELDRMGYPTLVTPNDTFNDVVASVISIGAAVGKVKEAAALADKMTSALENARAAAASGPPVSIMIVVDRSPGSLQGLYVAGKGSYFTELIDASGGKNIFDDSSIYYPQPSLEEIISRNPDVIIETRLGENLSETDIRRIVSDWNALGDVDAVKNNRIHIWTEDFVARPGPRLVLLLDKFRRAVEDAR
jgi:iron complex transport system substrate-binding protein